MSEQTQKTKRIQTTNNNDSDEIDLGRLFGVLLDSKWLIIWVTFSFTFMGIFYALMVTPMYQADALIQIEEKSTGLPGLSDIEDMFSGEHDPETEMALLTSRRVISHAVDELNLEISAKPKLFPAFGGYFSRRHTDEGFNQPFIANLLDASYAWGGESINVKTFTVSREYLDEPFELFYQGNNNYDLYLEDEKVLSGTVNQLSTNTENSIQLFITELHANTGTAFNLIRYYREDIVAFLQEELSVSGLGKDTGILEVILQGNDKQKTVDILDAISQGFYLQNIQRMSAEVQSSIDFINQELPKIKQQLDDAEGVLNDYRLKNRSVNLSLETQSILEQVVQIDTSLHELAFKEAEIAQRFTKEHPSYMSLMKKKKELAEQKTILEGSVQSLPETQQQVLRLMRDVEVSQQIYLALLSNNQELKVAKAGTVGNINIVDKAVAERKPIKPKKTLIVIVAMFLGGMLSIAFVLIKAAFNRGVTNSQDFEDIGLTVYANIPVSDTQIKFNDKQKLKDKLQQKVGRKKNKDHELLVAKDNPTDLAVEAIRSLRTSLHFAMLEAKNNVVMISGASPEVGKSFVSANLATVLAQAGQKVLIVDADMRRGYLQKLFDLKWDVGLSDFLSGKKNFPEILKDTAVENLTLISRGAVPPNPSELLMSQAFTNFIEQAQKDFDLVIIDTPPILAVTDPAIVGHHAGTSLMLARFSESSLKEIAHAAERFELNGIDIKGVIFNAVEKKNSHYYGNYSYAY